MIWCISQGFGGYFISEDVLAEDLSSIGLFVMTIFIGLLPLAARQSNPDAFIISEVCVLMSIVCLVFSGGVPFIYIFAYPLFEYAFATYCYSMFHSMGAMGIVLWLIAAMIGLIIIAAVCTSIGKNADEIKEFKIQVLVVLMDIIVAILIVYPMVDVWFRVFTKEEMLGVVFGRIFRIIGKVAWIVLILECITAFLSIKYNKRNMSLALDEIKLVILSLIAGVFSLWVSSSVSGSINGFVGFVLIFVIYSACSIGISFLASRKENEVDDKVIESFFFSVKYLTLPLIAGILLHFFARANIVLPVDYIQGFQSSISSNKLIEALSNMSMSVNAVFVEGISDIFNSIKSIFGNFFEMSVDYKTCSVGTGAFWGIVIMSIGIFLIPAIFNKRIKKALW